MNEIALSNNLSQIELEINHHKQIAGQSIWEIGRRLNHVKEHDLAHGQFIQWVESIGMNRSEAYKMMRIAREIPNVGTYQHLGTKALYLIATLPEEEQQAQLERIEQGNTPTVSELQLLRRKLSAAKQHIAQLESQQPTAQIKTVVKEVQVPPPDYQEALDISTNLAQRAKAAEDRNAFLENQLSQLSEQREKASQFEDIERAIEQGRGFLNEQQKEIAGTKETIQFLKKGNQFLASFGGVAYLDIKTVLPQNAQLRMEIETFATHLQILLDDVRSMIKQSKNEVMEGEIL